MPVLGLVLNLAAPPDAADAALRDLFTSREEIELGDRNGARLPAVLDVAADADVERAVGALADAPGVLTIDVVYAHFEDALEPDPDPDSDPGPDPGPDPDPGASTPSDCEEIKCR
jgi:hypothetical protein